MLGNKAITLVVDISLSMSKPYGDLLPSKIEAVIESLAYFARRALERGASIGVVVFFEEAIPLISPSRSYEDIMKVLSSLTKTYEGSSIGDGIVWGVKTLRRHNGYKALAVITDGEITGGIPLELALAYARNSKVDTRILLIGRDSLQGAPQDIIRTIHSKSDLLRFLGEILE